ncbi:sigma-70 family RNA polymerase sigma factor [Metabacillus sp. RGM 3146]|uniref:sigma-70 family RNA polymerase sigma factor n=1 Tax=Metabacillus sp. RGM 3146 TaxID=3401092 RepID=UPI003B998FA2
MNLNQYLKVFRKNIREASTILDSRKRSGVIYKELDYVRDTYFKEDAEGYIRFIKNSHFRINRGNREALHIPVYEYVVKNITTPKGKHSKSDGYYHFEYENDEKKNPSHPEHWSNAKRVLENEEGKEECLFNLTNVDKVYVLSNNSLGQSVEDSLIEKEESEELEKAIRQLTLNQQSIIYLHYFYGMPFKEIPEIMGCNLSNVYQINKSAIKKLSTILVEKKPVVKRKPSTPIVNENGSMKDYSRWSGHKLGKPLEKEDWTVSETRHGQLVGNLIVWEDGTFEEINFSSKK